MTRPAWAPQEVDLDRPSAARVYDYYLGGSHNFAVDREMARRAIADWPELPQIMRSNRAFLRRAVRWCVAQGVDQFLDIGSGIPTVGAVHEVARTDDPAVRVVYVDVDPVAVAHSVALLDGVPGTGAVQADLCDVDGVLDDPVVRDVLDLDRPVALLVVALLHFVADDREPAAALARYRERLAPGSLLVLSHASADGAPDRAGDHIALYRRTATPMSMRPYDAVLRFFDGFDLVEPGLVPLSTWRPDGAADGDARVPGYAGVGRRD
ncbi:SAM-dependent methyltransferase [Actinomycetospora chiangmaiensis]|uniref:SAM-dependent methyltransferase n=1 Tax=Actinomycetospora chiangmaiensis TaxID=402650 RepID=UPI00039CB2DD|nr:SAM-dependent methyltransferase [Actinomycetospora chiangmaiensis]